MFIVEGSDANAAEMLARALVVLVSPEEMRPTHTHARQYLLTAKKCQMSAPA